MPVIRGKDPKPRDQIRHRVKPAQEWVEVVNRPFEGPYPKIPAEARNWPRATRRWLRTVCRAPVAALFDEDDWEIILQTARVHARFWIYGDAALAGELRRRQNELGLTWHARRAMRIRYVDEDGEQIEDGYTPPANENVIDFDSYASKI